MKLMVEFNHEDLLNHQLTNSLITYKWVRMAFVFSVNLFFYALFLSLFTSFMVLTKPPFVPEKGNTSHLDLVCQSMLQNGQVAYDLTIGIPKYAVLVFTIIKLLIEVMRFCSLLLDYLTPENLVEIATYTLALLVVIDTNDCMRATGLRTNWQWIAGSIGIIVAWFNMMLFVRKGPFLGVYVIMFFKVLGTFVLFLMVFSPFLFGFVLAFHLLLMNQIPFSSIKNSVLTILAMLTGELNVGSVVIEGFNTTDYSQAVFYPDITYVVFAVSIALLTIVLMNLFVGLAVDDIKEIQRIATVESFGMKIDMILSAEYSFGKLGKFLRSPREYRYRPNVTDSLLTWYFNSKFEESMLAISAVAATPTDKLEDDDQPVTKQSLEQQVEDIDVQVLHIARLVNRLVDHSNVAESSRHDQMLTRSTGVPLSDDQVLPVAAAPGLQRLEIPDDVDTEPVMEWDDD